MKLLVYLELQLHSDFLRAIDVVVLASDITEGTKGLLWASETSPDKAIIYVDGRTGTSTCASWPVNARSTTWRTIPS
ncbi:hypothetical protein D3C87_1953260 [compost metagenome]